MTEITDRMKAAAAAHSAMQRQADALDPPDSPFRWIALNPGAGLLRRCRRCGEDAPHAGDARDWQDAHRHSDAGA
jgi:hypothetical protein